MIFSVQKNGDVQSVPSHITQGSFIHSVTVVAPFVAATCILRLKPPSEEWIEDIVMAPTLTTDGEGAIFTASVPGAITSVAGRLLYNLEFVGGSGEGVSCERGSVNILPGVVTDMPESVGDLSQFSLGQIYALLARISGNVVGLQRSVGDVMTSKPLVITIAKSQWSEGRATIDVPQVRENSVISVSYVPSDAEEYVRCGIVCVEQHEGGLVFSCETVPISDIRVQIIVMDKSSGGSPCVKDGILILGNATVSVSDGILILT